MQSPNNINVQNMVFLKEEKNQERDFEVLTCIPQSSIVHSMKRKIIQTKYFIKLINDLIKKRQILQEDFDDFKKELAEHPEMGDMIPGTNGVRKARLKSASRGKSGGSRMNKQISELGNIKRKENIKRNSY